LCGELVDRWARGDRLVEGRVAAVAGEAHEDSVAGESDEACGCNGGVIVLGAAAADPSRISPDADSPTIEHTINLFDAYALVP
jgi:hypothetical protein